MNYSIEKASAKDAPAITAIYNQYIRETVITFELTEIDSMEMERRIEKISKDYPWLVLKVNDTLLGYAYACAWRERKAYDATAETTIYLSQEMKQRNFHVLMGVIALPNPESAALHERLGFTKAAHFTEVGFKFNRWVDVGYWQLRI
jgi:phosphinothricin acetyltransferase